MPANPTPYLLLLLTILFWSGNFVLARAMHLEMPPITLAFFRWSGAFLLLAPWVLPRMVREWAEIKRHWGILLVLSTLGVANYNTFAYIGLQSTQASNAVLLQSAVPVLILVFSRFLLGQRIGGLQLLGVTISLSGVAVLVAGGSLAGLLSLQANPGDLWILAAGTSWALYSVCLNWRPRTLAPLTLLGTTILVGALLLLPFYLWEAQSRVPEWHVDNILLIGYVALFPSVLAYIFWNRGVAELGAARAGIFFHLMPVSGLILSAIFLGEVVQAYHLAGIALIFSGLFLANRFARGKTPE
ncbi:DMT family transporter [Motiliproteus sp. SC1-56]|uniref:DMT family transporter n=1 Tax=Motiliproteus sp. SC1-56 TaxID=2799565 RepID=UPI001F5D2D74|nr:DMT family transporter [Motiliproteus sp. SC1-56]